MSLSDPSHGARVMPRSIVPAQHLAFRLNFYALAVCVGVLIGVGLTGG